MPVCRFPPDLIALQRAVWRAQEARVAWILSGPATAPASWPLPRQAEYRRLTGAVREARRAVEDHPVMAGAIGRGEWAAAAKALRLAAREAEDEPAQATTGMVLTA